MFSKYSVKLELEKTFYGEIRDPLLGDIRLYRYEMEIMNTSQFQRLRGLRQLPGAEYVYPSMTHTRFSHSLGVLGLAIKIVNNSDLKLQDKDLRLLRVAAMLHDIQEPPFYNAVLHESFVTEELQYAIQAKNIKAMFLECEAKQVQLPVNPQEVIELLQGKNKQYLKAIINCEIGANRLDYLQRDSYFCGVKYGLIDDRILSSFALEDHNLVLKSEAIHLAEDILHNLYQMKVNVYDHKVVRSVLTLIRDAFRDAYENHNVELEHIFAMTDDEFLAKLGPDVIRRLKLRQLPKLVYELNTFSLKNPSIATNLDKLIREKEDSLIKYIAKHSDLKPHDIRIEPVELRRVGDADPLYVLYRRKGWSERSDSKRSYEKRLLQESSRTIKEWSEFFYEQWRVFIFCFVGETWDISKIDAVREKVADACDKVLGFLKYGEYDRSALPEFKEMFSIYTKEDPKEIRKKVFEQTGLARHILELFIKNSRLTTDQAGTILKCSRTSASLILNKLAEENLVTKERTGREVTFVLRQNVSEILKELFQPEIIVK